MPLMTTRDDQRRRLTVVTSGVVTIEDVFAFHDQQVVDGTWTYAVYYDGRDRESTLALPEIRRLDIHVARLSARHGPPGPFAIVRPDDAGFGVGRMFETLNTGHRMVGVFRDPIEAAIWLDMQLASEER